MSISGISEMLSIGIVIPFLTTIVAPEIVYKYQIFKSLASLIGSPSNKELVIISGLMLIIISTITAVIRIVNSWLNCRIAALITSDISCLCFKNIINKDYSNQIQNESGEVISEMTNNIQHLNEIMNALFRLITAVIISIFLIICLLNISFSVALISFAVFGFSYLIILYISRPMLMKNSRVITKKNISIVKSLQEGLGATREVIINNLQEYYLDMFKNNVYPLRGKMAQNILISYYPRYILEAIGITVIAIIAIVQYSFNPEQPAFIAVLGAIAISAQRLIPSFQQMYSGWATINGFSAKLLTTKPMP